jgi:hypothetical protein
LQNLASKSMSISAFRYTDEQSSTIMESLILAQDERWRRA